jgi:hypothetical protein
MSRSRFHEIDLTRSAGFEVLFDILILPLIMAFVIECVLEIPCPIEPVTDALVILICMLDLGVTAFNVSVFSAQVLGVVECSLFVENVVRGLPPAVILLL